MRYKFSDGKMLTAKSPEEFVSKMRNVSYAESLNVEDFMEGCANRALKLGMKIRHELPNEFLEDLIKFGIVIPVDSDLETN